jgi:hypothetical protein
MKGILFLYLFLYVYKVEKLNFTPVIDGIINEFENFEKIDSFFEFSPEEGKIPPVKTECYIAYDENNIYFAFKCYDDVKNIRKTLTKRDNFTMDDMVVIYLDTYRKEREGYIFGTNPLGVQYDGIKGPPPQNLEDWTFDTYFEVKSSISDSFWSCEFKIPFSSLRFENKEKQEWKVCLARIRPRQSLEIYGFPLISKNNPSFFGQGVTLLIPERIYSRERKNEFIPYLIGSESGYREEKYYKKIYKFNSGLTAKTKILQNLILDYAIRPDFAQIETDFPQIDVNTPFALYYPEKRPLFMEGKEMIETPINAIYTRMINNPLYALKLTGRISNFDLYFLSSYDKNALYILPFEDASFSLLTDKKSFINLLRVKYDFLNKESYLGILTMDREVQKDEFNNGFNRLFGFDTKIRFQKHYTFEYQGIYSSIKEPEDTNLFRRPYLEFKDYTSKFDGEKFDGFAQKASFRISFRNLFSSIDYSDYSPTFRSDLGYIKRNDFKKININISPVIYPNKYGFNSISSSFKYGKELNYENIVKNENFSFGFYPTLSFAQTSFGISWSKSNERIFNIYIKDYEYFKDLKNLNFWVNSVPFKGLSFETGFNTGNSVYYAYPHYLPAYQISIWSYFSLLFTKFIFSFGGERYYLYKEKYKNLIYDVSTFWASFNYSFTQNLSLRFIFTYNTYHKNPGFYPLISYQLTPFTLFYFGANINTIKYPHKIEGSDHQIFLKLQYSFKI